MERGHRPVVLGILAAALVLRLAFVCRLPARPLYWDEPHYDSFGRSYAGVWSLVGHPSAFLPELRTAFERTIHKGEAYSATVGLVYALVGAQPRAVFILQAVADAVGCLCVYGIAAELGGSTVGIIALVLATLYEPFIFTAARLQSETLSSCLFVGVLWAILSAAPRRELARYVLAGILLALAMLMRQALQYMFPLLLLMVPVIDWGVPWRRRMQMALAFSAGFFLVIGPRLVVTTYIFGHPIWGGARDPIINAYAGVVPENIGWQTDHLGFVDPPRGELLAVIRSRGVSTHPMDGDLHRATLLTLVHHPVDSAAVLLHKLYQAWAHPYNNSRWQFVTGLRAQRLWHELMLVLAVIGLPLGLRNPRVAVPLIATGGYLWGMYLAVGIEVRHAIPVLPLMLCFAALAAATLAAGVRAQWRARRMRRVLMPAMVGCGLVGLLHAFPLGRLLELSPSMTPPLGNELRLGVMLLVMLTCGALTFELVRGTMGSGWAMAGAGPALILGAAVFLVGRPLANVWHRWTCPLTDDRQVVRQEFVLPADLPPPQKAELRLDLIGARTPSNDLVVTVNGVEARRFVGGPSRDDAVLPPPFYMDVFNSQGRQPRPWGGWYAVPLALESLVRATLEVEVRVIGNHARHAVVRLLGDYPSDGELTYDGPSPFAPQLIQDTSIYRYVDTGDWRMRRRVPLHGASRSRFFDGRHWSSTDLSPAPGRQFGRYRILLLLRYPDGQTVAF